MQNRSSIIRCLVPYEAIPPKINYLVWKNSSLSHKALSNEFLIQMLNQAVNVENKFYSDNRIQKYVLVAERYCNDLGHGGGARVANYKNLQFKGVGENILSNPYAPFWYRYGGLNLVDGALEVVNSTLLNHIIPGSTNVVHALLSTEGMSGVYCVNGVREMLLNANGSNYYSGRGCILVRDTEIRPAHFLRVNYLDRSTTKGMGISADYRRIKYTWKDLIKSLGDERSCLNWIFEFGIKAISLLARLHSISIIHAGLTPSNITMEGKWLDLTTVKQYPFYLEGAEDLYAKEKKSIFSCLNQLFYNLKKYGNIQFETDVIFKSLNEQYHNTYYFLRSCVYIPQPYIAGDNQIISDEINRLHDIFYAGGKRNPEVAVLDFIYESLFLDNFATPVDNEFSDVLQKIKHELKPNLDNSSFDIDEHYLRQRSFLSTLSHYSHGYVRERLSAFQENSEIPEFSEFLRNELSLIKTLPALDILQPTYISHHFDS